MTKEEIFERLKKGYEFKDDDGTRYRVTSDLVVSGKAKIYYVDVISNQMSQPTSAAIKMGKNQGIVIRNMEKLKLRGYTEDEIMAIMAHELGHLFSENQQVERISNERALDEEIDSDTFAVEKCGIRPEVLESALRKDYNFKMRQAESKKVPAEKVAKYKAEMEKRIANAKRLQQEIQR